MMRPPCAQALATRAAVRKYRGVGNGLGRFEQSCRRYASSKRSQPPSPPPKQGRATPKPLPFQPTKPKTTPNPNSRPSSSSQTHEDKKQPISELVRTRWLPLFGAGAATLCMGFFTASILHYWGTKEAEYWIPGEEPETPTGRPSIQSPREFDQHLDKSEWRYGITKLRRRLAAQMARGHVLEVAVGAGRNFDYYDWSVVTAGLEPAEEKKPGWFTWSRKGVEQEEGKEEKESGKTETIDTGKGDEKEKTEKENENEKEKEKETRKPTRQPSPQLLAIAQAQKEKKEKAILSFTGVDVSPSMLDLALTRIRQVVPYMADQVPKKPSFAKLATSPADASTSEEGVSLADSRIRILKADAQAPLPPPPTPSSLSSSPPQKYDTILQTFGLCSVRDPIRLLSNLASSLQPDTGRIILLEHGRSTWWDVINGMLDRSAREHFERFGCWWNRDIEVIVRAAENAVPGLEVLRFERPGWITLGTHVLVEMRVRGDVAAAAAAQAPSSGGGGGGGGGVDEEAAQKSTTGWWSRILSVNDKNNDKPKSE